MAIRLRDPINQEPVFFVSDMPEISTEICCRCPIGSKELQTLLRVSQHLCTIVYDIYEKNMKDILKRYANNDTPLNRIISTQPNNPLISFETICEIQQSIIQQIKNMGVTCPNKHLGLEDIPRFNQEIEDLNLQKIWGPIRQGIAVEEEPAENASAQEIRLWMNENKNHLQNIVRLDLSRKALTTIPREITLLTGLQVLSLHNNQITVLPQGIFAGLNRLQRLALNHNQITVLPQRIFNELIQLRELDLSNNQITFYCRVYFDALIQLRKLDLSNNQITVLLQGIFDGLNQLQNLYLHYNQITVLPQRIFDGLNQVQRLVLHNNQITVLPQGIFDQLVQLRELGLHHNQITVLPLGIFDHLNQLQKLYLYNNQLSVLPQGIFDALNQLRELYLYGNPRLLFSYIDIQTPVLMAPKPALNNAFKAFKEFNAYVCRSSFAQFYQFVAQVNPFNDVMSNFSHLSPYLQNVINSKVLEEQNNSLSDKERFQIALKKAVRWIFATSSDELKNVIYSHVLQLAQEFDAFKKEQTLGLPPEDFTIPDWERAHAQDNILMLIDAMSLSIEGFES